MMNNKIVEIGTIIKPHGFKGKVKGIIHIDSSKFIDILNLGHAKIQSGVFSDNIAKKNANGKMLHNKTELDFIEEYEIFKPLNVSHMQDSFIADCANFLTSKNLNVQDICGLSIYTDRSNFSENTIIVADLIGLKVLENENDAIAYGTIVDIPNFGGGQLIEILPTGKNISNTEFHLLNDDTFPVINIQSGYVILCKTIFEDGDI